MLLPKYLSSTLQLHHANQEILCQMLLDNRLEVLDNPAPIISVLTLVPQSVSCLGKT